MGKVWDWLKKVWPPLVAGVKKGAAVVWAKIKTIKWTRTTAEIVGAVLLIVATLIIVGERKPIATPAKTEVKVVVENPTAKQIKEATTAITEQRKTTVTGQAKVSRGGMRTGSTVKISVSGTVETTYIDSKTKEQVGQGCHVVTGETTVTVQNDTVITDTVINDTNEIAVFTKPGKKLKNEVGYYFDGDQKLYYKRNVFTIGKKVELSGYVGGMVNVDNIDDSRAEAGVRVRW